MDTNSPPLNCVLLIDKQKYSHTMLDFDLVPQLQDGQILLRIELFSVTANNATYVALGKSYQYWDFFPWRDSNLGIMPVWGFATVESSKNESITDGERIFGYFPCSRYCVLQPGAIRDSHFIVSRPGIPTDRIVYNTYMRCHHDPTYNVSSEALISVFWPLWTTSYFLADMLTIHRCWDAKQIVITSASAKTAFCLADCIRSNYVVQTDSERPQLIGLTSPANLESTRSLNLYDIVLTYDQIDTILKRDTVVADVAGNDVLLARLRDQLQSNLKQTVLVGMSHYSQNTHKGFSAGAASNTVSFFAPGTLESKAAWIQNRYVQIGKKAVEEKRVSAWKSSLKKMPGWLDLDHHRGPVASDSVFRKIISGKGDPKVGYVVSML